MKKIIVIGCPGSGKSTFSRKLHQKSGIPLYHLDMMYWNEDKTTVSKEVFLQRLNSAMENDLWIIDGNYGSTMELRLDGCDTVIFLDYPTQICIEGIRKRRGSVRSDMPWVESGEDLEFLRFVESYNLMQRPKVLALLEKYSYKNVIVFTSRKQEEEYLSNVEDILKES